MLFKNKKYNRFDKLLKEIGKERFFNTQLGKRKISIYKAKDKSIYFTYFDKDDSPELTTLFGRPPILYMLHILKNGEIHQVTSQIDKIAQYSSIYEIENILYKEKYLKEKDDSYIFENIYRWY